MNGNEGEVGKAIFQVPFLYIKFGKGKDRTGQDRVISNYLHTCRNCLPYGCHSVGRATYCNTVSAVLVLHRGRDGVPVIPTKKKMLSVRHKNRRLLFQFFGKV